jgi:hypothetical protein
MMFPMPPATPMDPIERLKIVHEETEQIKADQLPQALERLTSLAELSPPALLSYLSRFGILGMDMAANLLRMVGWKPSPASLITMPPLISFIATNVPGVQVPQYLAGRKAGEQIGLIPLGGNIGYGVAILSYNQNLYFGMMAEPNMVPDVEFMKECVQSAFDELRTAANKHLASAQPPQEAAASTAAA